MNDCRSHATRTRINLSLGHRLTGPSGHAMLNDAALAMIACAQPFPPLPRDYPKQSFVYRFGVDFEIARR